MQRLSNGTCATGAEPNLDNNLERTLRCPKGRHCSMPTDSVGDQDYLLPAFGHFHLVVSLGRERKPRQLRKHPGDPYRQLSTTATQLATPQITPTARSPAAPGLVQQLPATRRKRRGLSGRKPHGLRLRCANGCRRDGPVGQCYGCY